VLDWQAKMDCFAALAMTDLDLCRDSLAPWAGAKA